MRTLLLHESDCAGKTVEDVSFSPSGVTMKFTDNTVFCVEIESDDDDLYATILDRITETNALTFDLFSNGEERKAALEKLRQEADNNARQRELDILRRLIKQYPEEAMKHGPGSIGGKSSTAVAGGGYSGADVSQDASDAAPGGGGAAQQDTN